MADIRARVKTARSAAQSEAEFRTLLDEVGVQVADNSAKAARADWIYSLADAPTRRVSGEKLGLTYGRESLLRRFEQKGAFLESRSARITKLARSAVDVADYYTPRITALYDYHLNALGREGSEEIDEGICATLAVPPTVVEELVARQEANKKESSDIEEIIKALIKGAR